MEFPDLENRKKRRIDELPVAEEAKTSTTPTKEELKRQKKNDRLTLNMLKIHIQPIMDQIRTKHKKFRTPVVDDAILGYLYEEQDPAMLSTDLTEEQRAAQALYRPFELATDKHGVQGLKETITGKFYYNLDTVMIEKRLSNGYYKRPKDFLADIKRIAKDARTSGDADRTIKANEMLANVEVDIQTLLETGQPALVAECEAVYAREQKREKEATEKAKQTATAAGEEVPTIRSNVPPQISTTTENTGPVMLGEQVPGRQFLPPITPDRQTHFTNGDVSSRAEQSNGTTVPSRVGEDVAMADSQDVEVSPTEVPPGPSVIDPNQQPSQQPSQRSAFEKVAYGSQVADYHNSASTTTSGQKSNRSSDRSHFAAAGANSNHTQSTNGVGASGGMIPDFSSVQQPLAGGSQLPDTQGENMSVHDEALFSSFGTDVSLTFDAVEYPTGSSQGAQSNSQPSQNSSQPFPVPPLPGPSRQHTAISSLLNTTEPPQFQLDEVLLGKLHDELVTRSSGLSVEQLEQVNAALMDAVWKEKTLWNRNKVIEAVMNEFNKTMEDIQAMQDVLDPSQRLLSRMGSAAAQMGGDGGVRSANGLGRAGGGTQTTGGLHSQMTGGLQSQISGAGGQGSQMVSQEH